MSLSIGQYAPDFTLPADDGTIFQLSDYKGKKVVLYFYPRDNTPGCTNEALDFKANFDVFASENCVIVGISADSVASHVKFKTKYELPFTLLSDESHAVCDLYQVYVLKKNYGKEYMGIERSTFIIDEEGCIQNIERKVSIKGHVACQLEHVKKDK